jgi:hypothetical protein
VWSALTDPEQIKQSSTSTSVAAWVCPSLKTGGEIGVSSDANRLPWEQTRGDDKRLGGLYASMAALASTHGIESASELAASPRIADLHTRS